MVNRFALFVAATGPDIGRNYIPDVNSQLNSLQKQGITDLDVYLLNYGFPPDWNYCEKAVEAFDFNVIPITMSRDDVPHPKQTNPIEFTKRARYFYLMEYAKNYDAVCLMDADMFVVSPAFRGLFDLVAGTSLMVGANERFKWDVGATSYFYSDGCPIFPDPRKLHMMICNVPCLFDMNKWADVFETYKQICFDGFQFRRTEKVGIGDLYAHNIAINVHNREQDIYAFPMSTFAQVHNVWRKPWTHIINDGGNWRTFAGDRIMVVHDTKKIATDRFVPGNMAKYLEEFEGWKDRDAFEGKIRTGLRALQKEWYNLNLQQSLHLDDFMGFDPLWETFA